MKINAFILSFLHNQQKQSQENSLKLDLEHLRGPNMMFEPVTTEL